MFVIFIISLSIIFYLVCRELDKPKRPGRVMSGRCPGCSMEVVSGWLVCPGCRTLLRETCGGCGKVHDSWVNFCPWCRRSNERSMSASTRSDAEGSIDQGVHESISLQA